MNIVSLQISLIGQSGPERLGAKIHMVLPLNQVIMAIVKGRNMTQTVVRISVEGAFVLRLGPAGLSARAFLTIGPLFSPDTGFKYRRQQ